MTSTFAFQSATSPAGLMDELEKFIVFWLGPRRPDYGEPESAILSYQLPYPLRRLYAFAGRWPPLTNRNLYGPDLWPNVFSVQDSLRPFSRLRRTEDGKVEFLDENQSCWVCAT